MVERVRNTTMTVNASNIEISPELMPGQRKLISITNISTGGQTIALVWGQDAPNATTGVVLYVGTTWIDSADSGYIPSHLRISAFASGAGAAIAIHERTVDVMNNAS